jgi:hypothetical protein
MELFCPFLDFMAMRDRFPRGTMSSADIERHASVRRFVFHDLTAIDGYLEPQDSFIIAALLEEQQRKLLEGSIVDIGVYFGRSYFLFRKASAPGTKVVGIDIFDSDATGSSEDQYSVFLENGRRLGLPVDEGLIISGDSTRLPASAVLQKGGKARFISIDGGHALSHVKADGQLASECLCDHGIIAFDDTHNPVWPEVTVGLADFIRNSRDAFCVVAFSRFKSYVCRAEYRDLYRDVLSNSPDLKFLEKEEVEYLGSTVMFLQVPVGNRILYELCQRVGLSGLSGLALSRSMNPGKAA